MTNQVANLANLAEQGQIAPAQLINWLMAPNFNAGIFNGTFGSSVPGAGTFTSLVVTTGGVSILGGGLTVVGAVSFGALDNTPIGSTTPSTGKFTTLAVTGLTGLMYANGASVVTVATGAQLLAAVPTMTATVAGLVPTPPNDGTKFLNGQGAFTVPASGSGTVTTVSVVTANGVSGSVANPTTTPAITLTLGAITPTSVNGLTVTTSTGTLTVTGSKVLTVSNTLTLAGTDSTTMTFPPASASIGYLNIPQNSQSAAYTTVLADSGKHLYHPSADTTARTWTIDSNANVAYAIGTAITFINDTSGGVITIAITSDTMVLAGTGTTGSRTLAANGMATAVKTTSTRWMISGTGLT